jgi:hypothetical protein
MRTLRARVVRELRLEDGYVSAASGLARARGRLYVAADDELALSVFVAASAAPGTRLALAEEELPAEREARKAAKADLEAVATLPDAGLVVMGSGSGDRRHRGFVTSLDGGQVREIDLHRLHDAIAREIDGPLNLEGAEWHAGRLLLAHRGVAGAASAIARVNWPDLALEDVSPVEPGALDGVSLGITDLARLPDGRLLASYAAEDAPDAYADGPITGSAIGLLGEEPRRLDGPWKVEGLWSDGREVLMVTDADDPGEPAVLLRAML